MNMEKKSRIKRALFSKTLNESLVGMYLSSDLDIITSSYSSTPLLDKAIIREIC